jgi:hypothetical protein
LTPIDRRGYSTALSDQGKVVSRYAGPAGDLQVAPYATYTGLPGGNPVLANVSTNAIDPLDPVVSGGDALDLADLAGDPLVTSGAVDLSAIHFVRLVDIPHGSGTDSLGHVIWDCSGATGSADFDAVAVIQHAGSITSTQPSVDLFLDASGYLNLRLEDPDGFEDLDRPTLHASFDHRTLAFRSRHPSFGADLDYGRLRLLLPVATPTPNGVHLRSAAPVVGSGRRGILSVSIRDRAGQFSADRIAIQG